MDNDKLLADLLREWVNFNDDPTYDDDFGDTPCFFCGASIGLEEHDPTCFYLKARAIVGREAQP